MNHKITNDIRTEIRMINIKYIKLNSNSLDLYKQDFEKLVLLYGDELDNHQNRITPKDILTKWANSMINIQGDTDRHLELCYNGDSLIGFLYGKIDHPDHKGYIKVGHGYIMEFYVLPVFRRNGYGKQMYSHLEELLISDGAKGLYLTSDPVTGKPFWEAMGYKNTGEKSPENNLEIYEKVLDNDLQT